MRYVEELVTWAQALDPAAAFLFLLPFVVAGAGLLQYYLEQRDAAASSEQRRGDVEEAS